MTLHELRCSKAGVVGDFFFPLSEYKLLQVLGSFLSKEALHVQLGLVQAKTPPFFGDLRCVVKACGG